MSSGSNAQSCQNWPKIRLHPGGLLHGRPRARLSWNWRRAGLARIRGITRKKPRFQSTSNWFMRLPIVASSHLFPWIFTQRLASQQCHLQSSSPPPSDRFRVVQADREKRLPQPVRPQFPARWTKHLSTAKDRYQRLILPHRIGTLPVSYSFSSLAKGLFCIQPDNFEEDCAPGLRKCLALSVPSVDPQSKAVTYKWTPEPPVPLPSDVKHFWGKLIVVDPLQRDFGGRNWLRSC